MNHQVDRRAFIAIGTAAIAGLATTRLHADTASGEVVSVGFHRLAARGRIVNSAVGGGLYDASSVMFSEPSFLRTGARFTIRGAQRGEGRRSFALDVHHPADNVDRKVVFHAWATGSNALSFNVPVELERTVDVEVLSGGKSSIFAFTVGSVPGALKLNPGKYIFAVGNGAPSWSSLRIDQDVVKNFDGSPVAFDYAVVSVASAA